MWMHECPHDPRRETTYETRMLIVSNPEGEPCGLCGMTPPPATDPRAQAIVDLHYGRHWQVAPASEPDWTHTYNVPQPTPAQTRQATWRHFCIALGHENTLFSGITCGSCGSRASNYPSPSPKGFTETSIKRGRFTFRKRVRVNE